MRPTQWRRSTHVVLAVAVIALVAAVVAVAAVLTHGDTSSAQAPPGHALVTANPGVVPVSDTAPVPTAAGLTAALALPVADPNLGNVSGRVTDAQTGTQLWEHRADVPLLPASTNKTLTTGAALLALKRDERVTTTVVAADQTSQPGVVVLVGGGDPILSAAPAGQETWYRGAARISDLADQVRKSGITATAVQVDDSLYSGPDFAPGWDPADIDGGDIAPMQSVMIDAGRIQPTTVDSARSRTPALDAGRALASALGVDPAKVAMAPGPPTGRQLAAVQGAPLMERLRQMMNASDNVMAESIAREVAKAGGRPMSFAGAVDAITTKLSGAGVDMAGATLFDSGGLSVLDRLTAKSLD
ncbi:MAG: D-alanyl-D-alanine carboxypeptidase/D-alanyl-D-alanine-endopeptidase, partial [Mycolicibacterium aromaticivorans]|nr:D-alanyl-D-alanine carboxypeptidase/D-alanyl-D-alanine-endopeptidase [Mycolicibacterium aromaticivorans]